MGMEGKQEGEVQGAGGEEVYGKRSQRAVRSGEGRKTTGRRRIVDILRFKKAVVDIEAHLLAEAQATGQEYTPKKPLNLLLDVCTRWNNVLFMLERALMFRQVPRSFSLSDCTSSDLAYSLIRLSTHYVNIQS